MAETSFSRKVEICNERGLHARASARFAQMAEKFDAQITVAKDEMQVSGDSIMGLMMLAAAPGSFITIEAQGHEARAALDALTALVQNRFGEDS